MGESQRPGGGSKLDTSGSVTREERFLREVDWRKVTLYVVSFLLEAGKKSGETKGILYPLFKSQIEAFSTDLNVNSIAQR